MRSHWDRIRFAILILVLIFEIASVLTLRIAGWNGTTVVLAALASALPVIVGLVFIFHRGRKFSIRSLLIATACFAGFIVITLQPLLKAQAARRVTIALQDAGIAIRRPHEIIDIYRTFNREHQDILEINNRDTSSEFPVWIRPIAGKLPTTARQDSVCYVSVESDAQLKFVCDSCSELTNLRMLTMMNISPGGIRYFAKRANDFEKLDTIQMVNCAIPKECLNRLTACRQMFLINHNNALIPLLTRNQLAEITGLPKLEQLMVADAMNDSDLKLLSDSQSLRSVRVYSKTVTPAVAEDYVEAFEKSNPLCKVIVFENK